MRTHAPHTHTGFTRTEAWSHRLWSRPAQLPTDGQIGPLRREMSSLLGCALPRLLSCPLLCLHHCSWPHGGWASSTVRCHLLWGQETVLQIAGPRFSVLPASPAAEDGQLQSHREPAAGQPAPLACSTRNLRREQLLLQASPCARPILPHTHAFIPSLGTPPDPSESWPLLTGQRSGCEAPALPSPATPTHLEVWGPAGTLSKRHVNKSAKGTKL